ncbi:Acyl-CoA dehydrogenase [Aquimixticola soesokkakensis]|uniref:Acyl-CoA dehydrogenase n=1 Tax=Aquimixticola soesokkakensis TaxID=1519096 RepID=A0A1Y5RYU0_9RHOB|nr:acyl-CoA dehydrogenase family protein [Aquimixticola soesokkakensis]SLN26044.1 Acyl-CoA dehydrogenase [Aquimixticola soesokkakensis]
MKEFSAPVDDIVFSLTHVAGADRLAGFDAATSQEVLSHFASFAEGVLAPLNAVGDRQGARLVNGRVVMPDGFREAYDQLVTGGWQGRCVPEGFEGMGLDPLTAAAVSEVFSGANHALQMVCNLVPGAVSTLRSHGSADQQARFIPALARGEMLATMCLTEAGAGSDLSRIRTRARKTDAGWQITGDKIFISGGDQDLSAAIFHLVLARSGAPDSGTRGLSLFLCDSRAARATISVTRIEEKLGLHASPTCQLAFDAAPAELIGEEGAGLAAMFTMMNHARLDVALQGVAHAARAADIARSYAAARRQGRRADGSEAVLADHADVARMLDTQDTLAIGARAMCHIALVELAVGERPDLADFLTPLCKIFATQAGSRSADLGLQVLGGYGYLEEYGLSQVWRDARITAIYEGANGIQALTTASRNLRRGQGAAHFLDLIAQLAGEGCAAQRDAWRAFMAQVQAVDDPSPFAHDFAQMTADLFFRAVWVKIAQVADRSLDGAKLHHLAQRLATTQPRGAMPEF